MDKSGKFGRGYIVAHGNGDDYVDAYTFRYGPNLLLGIADGSTGTQASYFMSSQAVVPGQFHHVAVTIQGTTATIYVDGMPAGGQYLEGVKQPDGSEHISPATQLTADRFSDNGTFSIGNRVDPSDNVPFTGLIDEVSVYNVALSATEIQAIYSAGSMGKCKGLQLTCTPTNGPTQVGTPYTANCTASSGTAPYAWSVASGALPTPLVLTPNGNTATISGTPTTPGNYNYTVQVQDSSSPPQTAQQSYSGTITGCSATADAVLMQGSHTLNVEVSAAFSSNALTTKEIGFTTIIGGVKVTPPVYTFPSGTVNQQFHAFLIDLESYGIPRFTDNARFTITPGMLEGGQACVGAPANAIVLLPTIIVPGIDPLSLAGSDPYSLDPLITYLQSESNVIPSLLGQAYRWAGEQPQVPYPTLYILNYSRNTATFAQGATALAALVTQIEANTYADRVNIVGHSKGGLVSRSYVFGNSSLVTRLIMCQTPNLGSLKASLFALSVYNDLEAVWNWYQKASGDQFTNPDSNTELAGLNEQLLPSGVKYYIVYSRSFNTTFTATGSAGHRTLGYTPGDDIVPWFSAQGLLIDPNTCKLPDCTDQPGVPIPAFNPPIANQVALDVQHSGFLNDPTADATLANFLLDQ